MKTANRKLQTVKCVRCSQFHESIRTYSICNSCLYDLRYNNCTGCGSTITLKLFTEYDFTVLLSLLGTTTTNEETSSTIPLSKSEMYKIVNEIWINNRIQNIPLLVEGHKWHSRCLFTLQPNYEQALVSTLQAYQQHQQHQQQQTNPSKFSHTTLSSFPHHHNVSHPLSSLTSISYYSKGKENIAAPSPLHLTAIEYTPEPYGHMLNINHALSIKHNLENNHDIINKSFNNTTTESLHHMKYTDNKNNMNNIEYPVPLVSNLLETMDKPLNMNEEKFTVLPSSASVYIYHPDIPPQQTFKSYSLEHLLIRCQCMGLIKERIYRFKTYKLTIIGKELINYCLYTQQCTTREEAINIGQAMIDTKLLLPIQTENIISSSLNKRSTSGTISNNTDNTTNNTNSNNMNNSGIIFEDKDTLYMVSLRKRASARDAVLSQVSYTQAYESSLGINNNFNGSSSLVFSKERMNNNNNQYAQTEKIIKTRRLTAASLSSPLPVVRVITVDHTIAPSTEQPYRASDISDQLPLSSSLTSNTNTIQGTNMLPPSWEMRLAGTTFTNHTLTTEQEQSNILYQNQGVVPPPPIPSHIHRTSIISPDEDESLVKDNDMDEDNEEEVEGGANLQVTLPRKDSDSLIENSSSMPTSNNNIELSPTLSTNNSNTKRISVTVLNTNTVQKRNSTTINTNVATPDRRMSNLSSSSSITSSFTTTKGRNNSIDLTTTSTNALPPPVPPSTTKTNLTTAAARIVTGAVMSIFKRSHLKSRVGIDNNTQRSNSLSESREFSEDLDTNDSTNNKNNTTTSNTSPPNTIRKLTFNTTNETENTIDDNNLSTIDENTAITPTKNDRKSKKKKKSSSKDKDIDTNEKPVDDETNELQDRTEDSSGSSKKKGKSKVLPDDSNTNNNTNNNNTNGIVEKIIIGTSSRNPRLNMNSLTSSSSTSIISNTLTTATTSNNNTTTTTNDYDGLGLGSDLEDNDIPKNNNVRNNNTNVVSSTGTLSSSTALFSNTNLNLMNSTTASSILFSNNNNTTSSNSSNNIFSLLIQPAVWREQRVKIAALRMELLQRTWKTGWLVKQGHVRKNWKKRWFILQGFHLTYSKKGPIIINTSTTTIINNNSNENTNNTTSPSSSKKNKNTSSSNTTVPVSTSASTGKSPTSGSSTGKTSLNNGMTTVITKAIEMNNDKDIIPAGILDIRDYTLEKAIIPRSSLCMRLCAKRVIDQEYYIYAETETEFVTWVKALSSAMRAWEDIDRSIAALQLAKSAALAAAASGGM